MLTEILLLMILSFIFVWSTEWIKYFNKLDERLGNSVWKWSYDYPVKGKRDISNLDDEEFVKLRRKRNKAVTFMYWIFFSIFIIFMSFITNYIGNFNTIILCTDFLSLYAPNKFYLFSKLLYLFIISKHKQYY